MRRKTGQSHQPAVLVVDSWHERRAKTSAALQVLGYRVMGAGSLVEALEMLGCIEATDMLVMTDQTAGDEAAARFERIRAEHPGTNCFFVGERLDPVEVARFILEDFACRACDGGPCPRGKRQTADGPYGLSVARTERPDEDGEPSDPA